VEEAVVRAAQVNFNPPTHQPQNPHKTALASHVVPFSKLFTDTKERVQCLVSTLAMLAAGFAVYFGLGGDWHKIGYMYGVPLLIFNAWITLVTYLQVRLCGCEERGGEGRGGRDG
jgi:fatty acid desaturase